MQYDDLASQDSPGWGVTSPKSADIVRDAMKKEKVIKCVRLETWLRLR